MWQALASAIHTLYLLYWIFGLQSLYKHDTLVFILKKKEEGNWNAESSIKQYINVSSVRNCEITLPLSLLKQMSRGRGVISLPFLLLNKVGQKTGLEITGKSQYWKSHVEKVKQSHFSSMLESCCTVKLDLNLEFTICQKLLSVLAPYSAIFLLSDRLFLWWHPRNFHIQISHKDDVLHWKNRLKLLYITCLVIQAPWQFWKLVFISQVFLTFPFRYIALRINESKWLKKKLEKKTSPSSLHSVFQISFI